MIHRRLPKLILLLFAVIMGYVFFHYSNPARKPPTPKPNPFEKPVESFDLYYDLATMVGGTTLMIDKTGITYYEANMLNNHEIRKGQMPQENIQNIITAVKQYNFFQLNDLYEKGPFEPTEQPYIHMVITVNTTKKRVDSETHSPPKALTEIEGVLTKNITSVPKLTTTAEIPAFCEGFIPTYRENRPSLSYTVEECKKHVEEVLSKKDSKN